MNIALAGCGPTTYEITNTGRAAPPIDEGRPHTPQTTSWCHILDRARVTFLM